MAFWRFGVDTFFYLCYNITVIVEAIMKDIRISVRLSSEEHEKLKILVIKKKTTINDFLLNYIREEVSKNAEDDKKN